MSENKTEKTTGGGMRWPIAIAIGLGSVVVVDFLFLWVANQSFPEIEQSYIEARR